MVMLAVVEQLLPSLHVTVYVPAGLFGNEPIDWKLTPSNE